MEKERKSPPKERDATIVEFPKSELQQAIERHPAKGREQTSATLGRLGIEGLKRWPEEDED